MRPFNDCGHGIFAQPDLATNQSVAASLFDQSENPRRQTVGLWSLPFLPAETFAARFRRRYSGADSLLDQLALEVGYPCDDSGQHAPVWRRQIEGEAAHCNDRHAARFQLLQGVQQIKRAAAPPNVLAKICNAYGTSK